MQKSTFKILAVVASIFFFTNYLTGMFLPVYYVELGLNIGEIVSLLLITFLIVGLLPTLLLKLTKNFERIICLGIVFTMLFYAALIYVKNPVLLGIAYGLSIAMFWPSFNLLQFRLSTSSIRARTVSLFSSIIPSIASIIGPAAGGFIIESFKFQFLFALSIILYLAALSFSTRITFRTETCGLSIPRGRKFLIFFATFILFGMTEAYWLAYPLFVNKISETISMMGLVLSAASIIMSVITFLVNWLSDIKMRRVEFTVIGVLLNALWFFLIGYASTPHEIVLLSILSGLAGAFTLSWFAHYGDSFSKEHYASTLVLMEVGLMIGRMINLLPTFILLPEENFSGYFRLLGAFSLMLIPTLLISKTRLINR
ncbi:MAG: MFS transporter [Candidatus Bathyarchaeia archaeon]